MEDLQRRLLVPERCFKLGQHAVVVTDVLEFMRRFGAAIAVNRYRAWSHLVRYYDPSSFHGHFEGINPVFRKRIEFGYQREYRFAIDTGTTGMILSTWILAISVVSRDVLWPKILTVNSYSVEHSKFNRTRLSDDNGIKS